MSKSNKNQLILLSQYIKFSIVSYKNRLTFAYYSITFWDFYSLQGVTKTWKVLKAKTKFLKEMFKYRNTVYCDFKARFVVIFSNNYRHCLVLEILLSSHIFPKISKYNVLKIFISCLPAKTTPPTPFHHHWV